VIIAFTDYLLKSHHKFAIIDVDGSDPVVVLGSYNWTSSGAYDNDENTLIIHDANLAQSYYQE
jgi:phosphatidylserine/phosphatidylglycerophosphate/cardiolipin synthase-like enzyme